MYEVNYNFNKVKLGETICYHIGNIGEARQESAPGGGFTDNAKVIETMATSIFNRSTAMDCTGEFELKQVRLEFNTFAYLAKKIRSEPTAEYMNNY